MHLKGVNPPVKFGERTRDCSPGQAGKEGPHLSLTAWWAAVHGVTKRRIRVSDLTFTFHFHALEKAMAPHSSVLAWRIPGTGDPVKERWGLSFPA